MTEPRALMATCGSIETWMPNAEGDDPCQIASRLLGQCTSTGVFNVTSISPGSSYPPPSSPEVNLCQCNTVAYSLMSACALCQNGSFRNFTTWVSNCPKTLVQYERYPNQTAVDVPPYAYLPLDSDQFNLAGAKALDHAASSSLSSSPASTMTVLTSTTMAASTSPANAISASKSPNNFLIAITVGVSLTLLTAVIGALMFCRRRHRKSHPYKPFFSRKNRPISLSISSIDSDSLYEGKVTEPRPASTWDRVFSNFRLSHKTPSASPYQRVKLSDPGLDFTPPSKQLSQTQMSIKPSSQTVPRGSNQRGTWAMVLSKIGLLDNVAKVDVPYTQVELSDEVENVVAPSHNKSPSWRQIGPLDQQTPMLVNPSTTWNVPNGGLNQPPSMGRSQPNGVHHSTRPKPTRIETLPVIQTITRTKLIRSSTIAEPSTTPRDDPIAVHRIPQQVESVPRPPGFTIEDTPTTTDGFPFWKRKRPLVRRDFFNPEIGGSMSSLGTFNSFSTQRNDGEDSDSVLLITRPSEIFSLTPKSDARSIRSSSATSVDDSSKSMAGSSRPPFSPAISSVVYQDTFRYGNPESRQQLIPASVRAAGYKGIPDN